jgi:hypothetical protein
MEQIAAQEFHLVALDSLNSVRVTHRPILSIYPEVEAAPEELPRVPRSG